MTFLFSLPPTKISTFLILVIALILESYQSEDIKLANAYHHNHHNLGVGGIQAHNRKSQRQQKILKIIG